MRAVIDDGSLQLHDVESDKLTSEVGSLAEAIAELRGQGEVIGVVSGWGSLPCVGQDDVATVLGTYSVVDRDVRNLLLGLLGKCPNWDDQLDVAVDDQIRVSGRSYISFGAAYAGVQALSGIGVSAVTMPHTGLDGNLSVRQSDGAESVVCFLRRASEISRLYRLLFELEDVPESSFFSVAVRAFPNLRFATSLTFAKFEGTYAGLRGAVVAHLAALNDSFAQVYREENGQSHAISSRIGIEVSIESGHTRDSDSLMKLRDVRDQGENHRCEWHSKIEPHRNRIHFCLLPIDGGEDRVFIGIFVDHLLT